MTERQQLINKVASYLIAHGNPAQDSDAEHIWNVIDAQGRPQGGGDHGNCYYLSFNELNTKVASRLLRDVQREVYRRRLRIAAARSDDPLLDAVLTAIKLMNESLIHDPRVHEAQRLLTAAVSEYQLLHGIDVTVVPTAQWSK